MKKIITSLLMICAAFSANTLFAQSCGNSGTTACVANGSAPSQGFEDMDSIPCIVRDSAYNTAAQFNMYTTFNFDGSQEVDSIQFVSMTNLPCGICWASSDSINRFAKGVPGCVHFSGTTNDPAGQYQLALTLTAWINHVATGITVPPALADSAGVKIFLRVRDGGASCNNVDLSGASDISSSCPAAINDISSDISRMSINPNPMNSAAQLSFTSETSTSYLMRITNIAGQELSVQEIKAINGLNKVDINRNNMADGLYLVTLSNGKSSITRKLVVLD